MKSDPGYIYPVTKETIHDYAESVFRPIRNGECVTTIWVPMAGRRMWNKFIIENINLFEKELPNFNKYLLVYIEPLDLTEESLAGYIRLLGKSLIEKIEKSDDLKNVVRSSTKDLFEDDTSTYTKMYENLKRILTDISGKGYVTVFFLGEFDELYFANSVLYNNLQSLRNGMYPSLHYVFLSVQDLSSSNMGDKFKELNNSILQNIVYVPIRKEHDIDYLINFFVSKQGKELTAEQKKLIKELCGGHPFLIRAAIRILLSEDAADIRKIKDILASHHEILSIVRRIFALRTDKEKDILHKIVNQSEIVSSNSLKRLMRLGLVELTDKGKYKVFSELFENVIKESDEKFQTIKTATDGSLYLNENGTIYLRGKSIEEMLTGQEYKLIHLFLKDPEKLRSRDDIGEVLWGSESYEKYSDWAIDQLMSKLRKKLEKINSTTTFSTVRGRGYKLTN